jgi:predicted dehydrogenase
MHAHPSLSVLFASAHCSKHLKLLFEYLQNLPHLHLDLLPDVPEEIGAWDVVVTEADSFIDHWEGRLEDYVRCGGGWLHLAGTQTHRMPEPLGVRPNPQGPLCELRVLFDRCDHPLSARLPDAIYVQEYFNPLALEADDVEMILYADWHFGHSAVLVQRPYAQGMAACSTLLDLGHPVVQQIYYRLIRTLGQGPQPSASLGVGLLGYAPSVGRYHGQGIMATPGLALTTACDLSQERLSRARDDFPEIGVCDSADALGEDPDVDLVIIATPPNTHARLATRMMAAGKHVVVEKPLALNQRETAAMGDAAALHGVHLSCHQNRRWDVDYRTIHNLLAEGQIGDLFYLETFVGGFSHPCGYWHSDMGVSGGTAFDWGGHYIDWIIGLCGHRIAEVIGTRHKRVWHDVTNADQERIQIRFENGVEAEFMHSDIAAVRKPKWYVLGTRGAIVGQWQDVTEYEIDPVHYFHRHDIPATEMPPDLTIIRSDGLGNRTLVRPALAERLPFGFHANLADHLLTGEPLAAPLEDSMKVVTVLEAAARSMDNGGRVEVLNGG